MSEITASKHIDTSPRKEDKRGNSSSSTKEENGKVVIQLDKVEREFVVGEETGRMAHFAGYFFVLDVQ
nr:hypothetical protein [Prevotella pallens]